MARRVVHDATARARARSRALARGNNAPIHHVCAVLVKGGTEVLAARITGVGLAEVRDPVIRVAQVLRHHRVLVLHQELLPDALHRVLARLVHHLLARVGRQVQLVRVAARLLHEVCGAEGLGLVVDELLLVVRAELARA